MSSLLIGRASSPASPGASGRTSVVQSMNDGSVSPAVSMAQDVDVMPMEESPVE